MDGERDYGQCGSWTNFRGEPDTVDDYREGDFRKLTSRDDYGKEKCRTHSRRTATNALSLGSVQMSAGRLKVRRYLTDGGSQR